MIVQTLNTPMLANVPKMRQIMEESRENILMVEGEIKFILFWGNE
jgi:hypothetical protein